MLLALVALTLGATAAEPEFERPTILVWRVANVNAPEPVPQVVTSTITEVIGTNPHVRALSASEIKAMLALEADRTTLGQEPDAKLLANVAKGAQASLVVFATTSQAAGMLSVDLGLFDVTDSSSASAVHRAHIQSASLDALKRDLAVQANILVDKVLDQPLASVDQLARAIGCLQGPLVIQGTPFATRFGADVFAKAVRVPACTTRGAYRENGDVVEVAWVNGDGKKQQARLLKGVVDAGALTVANLEAATHDQHTLEPVAHDFGLEAWTDKGARGVVFAEGEEMRLWLKVAKRCHVRVLYHLADGTRTLVGDDLVVEAGKPVQYPQTFEPAPPFGIERIQVVAFEDKPPAIVSEKRTIDGVSYDVVASVDEAVRHRGYVKRDKKKVAEALITLTTVPRS